MVAKIGRFIEMFLFSAGLSFGECLFYKNSNIICDSCDIELFLSTQYVPKVEQNVFFCFFVLKNILFFYGFSVLFNVSVRYTYKQN